MTYVLNKVGNVVEWSRKVKVVLLVILEPMTLVVYVGNLLGASDLGWVTRSVVRCSLWILRKQRQWVKLRLGALVCVSPCSAGRSMLQPRLHGVLQ